MFKAVDSFFAGIELGKADIKDAESVIKKLSERAKTGVFLQLLDARCLCSEEQFFFAAKHAIDAVSEARGFSNRLEIELLLRLTATRQIGKALEIAGIKEGEQELAIVGISQDTKALQTAFLEIKRGLGFKQEDLLKNSAVKNRAFLMKAFNVTEKELLALKDLKEKALESAIIERIALNALNE